jgi:ethanolamine utilization cobalamin adenosyltransferase
MGVMPVSVLTEASLRILLKDEDLDGLKEYRVEADVIVTPSARSYLIDHRIDLVIGDKRVIKNPSVRECQNSDEPKKREQACEPANGEKPEYMTSLRAGELVYKDHKIIKLRGKIDSFEAKLLETRFAFRRIGSEGMEKDLAETLDYTRAIMRSEVLNEAMPPMMLFGLDEEGIHDHSHNPMKYFGVQHFMPITIDDGEAVLALNVLRAMIREAEIAAFEAFRNESGVPEREDIVKALNRLSSALYVMMLRAKAGEYD